MRSLDIPKSYSKDDFQLTNESLKDTYKDFDLMPLCTERFLLSLRYLISCKLIGNDAMVDQTIMSSDYRKLEIDEELQCLKLEEISSTKIQHAVETLSIYMKHENWKSSLIILKEILHEIMPLNIYELFRLVKSVDDTANLIKDKKIIFSLGNTGSGKSTTIHFILDTFNLDKSNEPVYKAFDYYTVEKALVYLDACKTFFILKNDSILILNCLENYIRNYINFIKDEIKGYFDIIKQNKTGNEDNMLKKIE
ncbi:unnamed protein product [Rotaria magnacalcarata]